MYVTSNGVAERCEHKETEIRARRVRGGAVQYVRQCMHCGGAASQAIPKSMVPATVGAWDDALEEHGNTALARAITEKRAREKAAFDASYAAYMHSDEWRAKRKAVMLRAQGICEGCRAKTAVQVHHLHYRRVFREMLFDLVAICKECHEACHADNDEQ